MSLIMIAYTYFIIVLSIFPDFIKFLVEPLFNLLFRFLHASFFKAHFIYFIN